MTEYDDFKARLVSVRDKVDLRLKQMETDGKEREKMLRKCCAKCGIDLRLVPSGKVTVGGRTYCDVCAARLAREGNRMDHAGQDPVPPYAAPPVIAPKGGGPAALPAASRSRWKAYLAIGLILFFFGPVPIAFLVALIPALNGPVSAAMLFAAYNAGVFFCVASLAQRRRDRGEIRAKTLWKALTPAQICLCVSTAVYSVGVAAGVAGADVLAAFPFLAGTAGIIVSAVLAIRRGRKIRQKRQLQTPPPSVSSAAVCEECGERVTLYRTVDGRVLCCGCEAARLMAREHPEWGKALACACSVCGKRMEEDELTLVDGALFCPKCYHFRFPGSGTCKNH